VSEPKRYDADVTFDHQRMIAQLHIEPSVSGKWVEYADYAALQAENERLTHHLEAATIAIEANKNLVKQLKDRNERLSRDANELADNLEKAAGNTASHYNCLIKWRTSKEGQS